MNTKIALAIGFFVGGQAVVQAQEQSPENTPALPSDETTSPTVGPVVPAELPSQSAADASSGIAPQAADVLAPVKTPIDDKQSNSNMAPDALIPRAQSNTLVEENHGDSSAESPMSMAELSARIDALEAQAAMRSKTSGRSGFMDVRMNLTLTNENVFAKPGETIPSVPGWRLGRPNSLGVLFFDNYDTRFSGYETLSHAVLYKKYDHKNWEVEGSLVLRINDLAQDNLVLSDAGSYMRVAYWFDDTRQNKNRVSITGFPTSSDRFRLGYSYRLSWGGSPEYRRSQEAVPGVKIQMDTDRTYSFVGAKSAVVLDRSTAEEVAVLAFLAGAGIDFNDMVRFEVNGGYFDRGSNELQDVITEKVQLFGASAQLSIHDGMPLSSSIDFRLYRNDPERVMQLFTRDTYPGGLSWLVTAEATMMGQTLKDPNVSGGTTIQRGAAADINARLKFNRTRFRFDAQYRDLGFILHSTPSLPTFSDFPDQYERTPNYFVAAGVDHNIVDTGLTLGIIVGLDKPATLTTPTGVIPGDSVSGSGTSTAVIRGEGDITILPQGESAVPQFAAKFLGRLDFAEHFAALVDIYYARDANQTRLRRSGPDELLTREFGEFNQLGFNFTLQAKF